MSSGFVSHNPSRIKKSFAFHFTDYSHPISIKSQSYPSAWKKNGENGYCLDSSRKWGKKKKAQSVIKKMEDVH